MNMRAVIVRWLAVTFVVTSLSVGFSAHAQTEDETIARAKEHYINGKEHYAAKRYQEALDAFKESYNLSGEPNLLFNLGLCSEKVGDSERAIAYYEVYLEELPDSPDTELVRKRMENIINPPPPVETETEAEESVADSAQKEPEPKKTEVVQPPKTSEELAQYYNIDDENRKVFLPGVFLGIGGLVLAGGAITGGLAYKDYDSMKNSCSPNCSDDDVDGAKNQAIVADVLFGVGAVTVAIGVVLWIVKGVTEEKEETQPDSVELKAGMSPLPGGGGLMIEGRF
jgi:tetratricopeptide (TPR) repeat protein